MNKTFKIVSFLLLFLLLGYFREFFFVHINNVMYMRYYNRTTALAVPAIMNFFTTFSYDTLYYMKYAFTVLWTLLFFFANVWALKNLAGNPLLIKILFFTYCIMFALAAVSMTYGYLVKDRLQDDEYTISRWLLGIAQSPIICLILLASEKLYTKGLRGSQD